jgi:AcrR family transcriptional regulator
MGRKAGVAAEETKASLLEAAAKVFARRGYDGASIAEITSEAGLTSGAIYAHYGSKAELFVATLQAFGDRDLDRLLGHGGPGLLEGLTSVGATFDRRGATEESLVISAVIASRHHPEVAALLIGLMRDRETLLRDVVAEAQSAGVLSKDVTPAAVSRLSMVIALGSVLAGALGVESVDHEEWAALIARLVRALGP